MKRSIVHLLLCVATVQFSACTSWQRPSSSTYTRAPRSNTIALAITVNGVLQPTPQQYAIVQAAAVKQFGQLGYTIVTDLSLAERIVRIDFAPDPLNPDTGRANVLGFRSNPYYASASTGSIFNPYPYPSAFGYAGQFSNLNWYAMNNFGYGYYGYSNSYYDGYTYSTPTLNPVQPVTPTRPHHTNPPFRHDSNQCPADMQRVKPLDGTLATNFTPVTPANYPPSGTPDPGHWHRAGDPGGSSSTGSTYAASSRTSGSGDSRGSWRDRANSSDRSTTASNTDRSSRSSWWSSRGSDSSSSSSSNSGSSWSNSSSSSSYSSSSYSSSSSSYSSSDSSSSSSSGSSSSYSGGSSGSSYSGSGGTVETTASRQQN